MPLHKNETIQLTIENISNDGNGVGRANGLAVFVPASAVGDVLEIKITKAAKNFAYGRIQQIVTPGPSRQTPDCPIASQCGGCCFRHLSYEAELKAKHSFVQDAMRRIGKLDVPVPPVLPSPQQNRYRNKVQYPVAQAQGGGLVYGFYAARSHRVVPCSNCLLQPEEMNEIAATTVQLLEGAGVKAYDEATRSGLIRHLYLRGAANSQQIMLCVVATQKEVPKIHEIAEVLVAAYPAICTVLLNINPANTNVILGPETKVIYGTGHIEGNLCGVPLRLGVHSFQQVNAQGAQQLFALAKQYANPGPTDILVDLYCGAGVIGLSMAGQVKSLIGVEIVAEAVQNARRAATQMGLANTRFLCEDAAAAAARFAADGMRPDIIAVDPPRKGCDGTTLAALVQMAPERIVMVSCNPATMARDLAYLTANGYTIARLQPVDMFPRTKHVECVALLRKKIDIG